MMTIAYCSSFNLFYASDYVYRQKSPHPYTAESEKEEKDELSTSYKFRPPSPHLT